MKNKYTAKLEIKDWKKTILDKNSSMQDAIKILDKTIFKIILILNKKNQLLGTVTDGDIRRALLKKFDFDTKLKFFMFKKPSYAFNTISRSAIIKIMNDNALMQMPIIDKNKKVIGLETLQSLLSKKNLENPVLLMAGGYGMRLRPLTIDKPKPMLEIGDKPLLEIIINQFKDVGFKSFYISTHFKAEKIEKHFKNGENFGVNIKYLLEKKPLGTAGALSLLPKTIKKLPLIVMNTDLLTKVDFLDLLNFHNKNQSDITLCVREKEFKIPYGVIEHKNIKIIDIKEKPTQKIFINAGIYVINNSILSKLKFDKFKDMPNIIKSEIKKKSKINMFPIHEYWTDIGGLEEYTKASEDIKSF